MVDANDVERWATAADFVALSLLYLDDYPVADGELCLQARPYSPGHWGCVPGLNFIWANLTAWASERTSQVRPVIGTGHAGAAWSAWRILQESDAPDPVGLGDLRWCYREFGGGRELANELFGISGVKWPTGELGYALAVAQGASNACNDDVVVVIGDGELETGATSSALIASRVLPRWPVTIVNANGLRMGGPSWLAGQPGHGARFFESLGYNVSVVLDSDVAGFQRALAEPSNAPRLIIYQSIKGGVVPREADSDLTFAQRHKLPVKAIDSERKRTWLHGWLTELWLPEVLTQAGVDSQALGLPPRERRVVLNSDLRRRTPVGSASKSAACPTTTDGAPSVVALIDRYLAIEPEVLITTPDEGESNRIPASSSMYEILSEQVALGWAIGASLFGRPAIYVTYEAFAPIVLSMLVQLSRHTAYQVDDGERAALTIVLTSLSYRNVASHQDVSFVLDLESRELSGVEVYFPYGPESARQVADILGNASSSPARIGVVVCEKVIAPTAALVGRLQSDARQRWHVYAWPGQGELAEPAVLIVTIGEWPFNEACRVGDALSQHGAQIRADVAPIWKLPNIATEAGSLAEMRSLFAKYQSVLFVSMSPTRALERLVAVASEVTSVGLTATYRPTDGVSEVHRCMQSGLDWLHLLRTALSAFGMSDDAAKVGAYRAEVELNAIADPAPGWYYLIPSVAAWGTPSR